MMGVKERHFSPLPREVSLEDLVPKDNFYRLLEEKLDLSFVRDLVRPLYAEGGRPSVDPVVFFGLQLVMFFEGLRSERELMRVAADRLSVRWFLGYDLHEPLPDHSCLTRTRERFGLEVFRWFFERIVEMCIEAGLVRGEELFFDSTKVKANADVDSLCSRSLVENHLGELFKDGCEETETGNPDTPPALAEAVLPTAENRELLEKNLQKSDWISRAGRQDRAFTSGARKRTADMRVSRTDPDATPMPTGESETKLGYQTHYVIDGGKARIILNALVAPFEVSENRPMLDLLWRGCFRWKLRPHHVTADGIYGTAENIADIEKAGIRAYVALHEAGGRKQKFFPKSAFIYDVEKDLYACPGDEFLRFTTVQGDQGKRYKARAKACSACSLKPQCTTNKEGRTLFRHFDEEYLDRVRSYRDIEPYKKALRKRKVWIEPLFAEAKDWHGMRRFRLRGLKRVNIEALVIAAGQNIKRLLTFAARKPKRLAQAAALHPPVFVDRGFRRIRAHRVGRLQWLTNPVLQQPGGFIDSRAPFRMGARMFPSTLVATMQSRRITCLAFVVRRRGA
jgi:transposase